MGLFDKEPRKEKTDAQIQALIDEHFIHSGHYGLLSTSFFFDLMSIDVMNIMDALFHQGWEIVGEFDCFDEDILFKRVMK